MPTKDAIDSMIETWATGLGEATRVPATAGAEGDLAGFSLTPAKEAEATPLDAARAVREAVVADTGRRKHLKTWSSVARKVLGLGRLSAKRYDEVLEAGYSAGLFRLDEESLSYPILVALDPKPEPKVEPEPEASPAPTRSTYVPTPIPEDWDPPTHLPCGHWNHQLVRNTDTVSGFPTIATVASGPGPDHCPACADGKTGNPRYQVGEWRKPVPVAHRRTKEKSDPSYPGFPGLCTDPETGLYIGGLANNCARHHDGDERCEVHAAMTVRKKKKRSRKASA
jgi:hypothetical protein